MTGSMTCGDGSLTRPHWCRCVILAALAVILSVATTLPQQTKTVPNEKKDETDQKPPEPSKRIELNLLGKTDTNAGESRRNENIQFNLIDNNALKELNVRLGTSATIIHDFSPARNYFGSEFGNAPVQPLSTPEPIRRSVHGSIHAAHLNSIFSARSFFQVGDVKPAHDNDYGMTFGAPLWKGGVLFLQGNQQKTRGSVNGNVLVPQPDERTPLATDPAVRAIVARFLAAYPAELPNRTDINPRALNTNSPQVIDNNDATARLDQDLRRTGRLAFVYSFTSQNVNAFQLVAGQNPDTNTKSQKARVHWSREWSATTVTDFAIGYDRLTSLLRPEENAVGPLVSVSGLESLGPQAIIPIDRTQNLFRYSGLMSRLQGSHSWTMGFGLTRRQLNGVETDAHRGVFSFGSDFGRNGITNLRLGTPTQYLVSLGNVSRGFRNWDMNFFAGDTWRISSRISLRYALRYEPALRPVEAYRRNVIPYPCDCNNVAPLVGIAWRLPRRWGVLRGAYGLQYGQIFPVTFQQVRFSPPGSVKFVVLTPDLIDPLRALTQEGSIPAVRGNLYLLDPNLVVPYSHQYNLSWEADWSSSWKLQLGYVGSRSDKLLIMWYLNRGQPVPGIPQTTATINLRRADPEHAEIRWVLNSSRGYYDAARVSLVLPERHGLTLNASYWFSKALDLGSSYTNTAYDADTRLSRSQSEFETHHDMKGLSAFDQPQAFLFTGSYALHFPSGWRLGRQIADGWKLSAVILVKSGTPFTVLSGSDGPGYGNVDGNGNDRPNLNDPSILGRTVGDPDTSARLLPRSAFGFMNPTDPGGNLGRSTFRKGAIRNVNAALSKTWEMPRGTKFSFRAESINLFNTPQFAEPGVELANANFGQITNTLNDGRTFRFHVQLAW
jgi:hypothetical protein